MDEKTKTAGACFILSVVLLGWIPGIGIPLGIIIGLFLFYKITKKQ